MAKEPCVARRGRGTALVGSRRRRHGDVGRRRRFNKKFKFMHDAESAPMSAVFHLLAIFVKVVEPAAVARVVGVRGRREASPWDRLHER